MGQIIRNAHDHSLEVLSNRGIIYSLYEGTSIDGNKNYTSDIVFIMLDGYCDKIGSNTYFINYMFGSSSLYRPNTDQFYIDSVNALFNYIDEWESAHPDIVETIIGK